MRWRLIRSQALSGAMNMAIDEALLLVHAAGKTLPTLRLYEWSPPAVSLGLLQPVHAINERLCHTLGYDLVRRPSGGGAVLHEHEVTYAIVMDGNLCPEGSSVLATYRWLSAGLTAALQRLGIAASPGGSAVPKSPNPKPQNPKPETRNPKQHFTTCCSLSHPLSETASNFRQNNERDCFA